MENELTEVIQCAEWLERLTIQASLGKISKRFALIESSLNLRRLHARVQQLEEFAKAVEQYGILLRAGGAAPHDFKDLSAALEQCVELAQGVLK